MSDRKTDHYTVFERFGSERHRGLPITDLSASKGLHDSPVEVYRSLTDRTVSFTVCYHAAPAK